MNNLQTKIAQMIDPIDIPNVPISGEVDSANIASILQIVFGVFAAVAVLTIAIAALMIVISRGNPEDVSRARDAIIYAAIGLAISMLAFTIVTFVVERI